MLSANRWAFPALIIAGLILAACGGSSLTSKSAPAEVEPIEGSELVRVRLSASAADRLDVQTAQVLEEEIVRKVKFGGEVVASLEESGDGSAVWVRVALSEGSLAAVARGELAVVLPLARDGVGGRSALTAQAVEGPEEGTALYYEVEGAEHGLVPGQPVLVELPLSGSQRKVVPYTSVIYDVQGDTWVYTSPEPLVFVRAPITVDYIEGERAVLLDGPEAGISIVTVGAAELLGVEAGVGQ